MMKTPENLELVLRLVLLPTERVQVDLDAFGGEEDEAKDEL